MTFTDAAFLLRRGTFTRSNFQITESKTPELDLLSTRLTTRLTFRADVGAWDAHFDAVLLHLHLVAGTRSDAGAVVHHEVICQKREAMNTDSPSDGANPELRDDGSHLMISGFRICNLSPGF